VFLVGGAVRDLCLSRENIDLDLVTEGEALSLSNELAKIQKGQVVAHSRFGTAKIKWDRWSVDIAAARIESYREPGQLPTIEGSTNITGDLKRRDFSINAMALRLEPALFGEIIDPFIGRRDLADGLIRVMHENSFQDDATRIWRAVRYEQRLGFQIETKTQVLIKRDLEYLERLSGDRLRAELELCLEEEKPEKVLRRAVEIGIFRRLWPAWAISPKTWHGMANARDLFQPYTPPLELYLAILCANLKQTELESFLTQLNFNRSTATTLRDSLALQNSLGALTAPDLSHGQIYHLASRFNPTVLLANRVILREGPAKERIDLYLNQLRQVKIQLNGQDIIMAGYPAGPAVGQVLQKLKEAKLDGLVNSVVEERAFVKQLSQDAL
jgi:tRNA nucleotidyltransferase (CCA-adding enzyme)